MKEIIRITLGLTVSCLIAALVMGSVFIVTDKAKRHNEHVNVQNAMLGLLGYTEAHPAPSDLRLYTVYRYIIEDGDVRTLGYMVPVTGNEAVRYQLVVMDLDGQFVDRFKLDITPEKAQEAVERASALKAVLKPPRTFVYSDSTIIARLGKKRLAYLLPGKFPGFKTFIQVILAIDPSFEIIGLEIMEHEEDPGLGAEIKEDYFKNQFKGKSFEKIKNINVTKEPLPKEYKRYLEAGKGDGTPLPKGVVDTIRSKYQDRDIYALTGATISSKAVTDGVKNIIKKFAYRMNRLDSLISEQHIPVAF
ncbi:MAG: FMN-binding protein [Deltaproteobacteria bacterium]|nr:FMN-binding protein [Deltaproteobacteria bacterium]MBW2353242.1 FMN-binding protein [Deltaproteobacteria bacterium]